MLAKRQSSTLKNSKLNASGYAKHPVIPMPLKCTTLEAARQRLACKFSLFRSKMGMNPARGRSTATTGPGLIGINALTLVGWSRHRKATPGKCFVLKKKTRPFSGRVLAVPLFVAD